MKLISCTIENFGKLNNVTYDFSGECNTICEDNGWGKSTLASFIRVMFYGFKNESKKKLVDKERNRLMPWQKGVYGGEIVFETGGVVYSLRRTFGKKQADDEFLLVRKDTNVECDDFSCDIGEELFKIDAQSFERTVFIGQSDCVTATTDSINAKIGNLADNTDDINNFETAVGRLTAVLNNITSTRSTGSISKRKSRITELAARINNYSQTDRSIEEQTDIRDNLCAKREELRADRKKMQEQQKHLSVQKDIQALKEKYQLLDKECNNKKNAFEQYEHYFNGELPEKEDVHKQIEIFDEAGRLSGKFTHIDDDDSKRLEQLRGMFEQGVPDSETIYEWQNTAGQLDELKEAAAKNRLSDDELEKLEWYKKRFARGIPDENKVGKIHDIWISAQNKQNSIVGKEMKLDLARENEQARLERAKLYKNSCVPGIIAGIVMAVIGGVLVVPVMEVGIAMIIVGLCMAVVFSVIGTVKKKQHDSEFMNISAESDNKLKAIEADINDDKNFISGTENVVRQFCEEYEITFSRDNIAWELSGLCHDIEDYRELEKRAAGQDNELSEQIKQLENRLDVFLKQYNCATNGNNYSLTIERIRNDMADYKRINQEMSKQDIYRNQYEQNMSGIKCFLRKYIKGFKGEESVGETLRNLDKKLDGYYRAKSEYDNAMMIKADFESENDISMFTAQNDADKISLEDIASDMTRVDNMIEEYAQQISQCNKQLENLQIQADECENCRQQLNQLTDIQESEKNKERLLKLTKQIMEDSKQSFTSEYMGPVMSGFRKYYTILTGCEPDAYNLDADTKLTVMEQNMPRDIGYLSAGKQDLVGVCMRMALVEAMYKEEKPFLIFDDPFVNLDDNNIKGAMKLLDEIAKNYQVIYFTCSESRIHN